MSVLAANIWVAVHFRSLSPAIRCPSDPVRRIEQKEGVPFTCYEDSAHVDVMIEYLRRHMHTDLLKIRLDPLKRFFGEYSHLRP